MKRSRAKVDATLNIILPKTAISVGSIGSFGSEKYISTIFFVNVTDIINDTVNTIADITERTIFFLLLLLMIYLAM
jgi:hypothetical protein